MTLHTGKTGICRWGQRAAANRVEQGSSKESRQQKLRFIIICPWRNTTSWVKNTFIPFCFCPTQRTLGRTTLYVCESNELFLLLQVLSVFRTSCFYCFLFQNERIIKTRFILSDCFFKFSVANIQCGNLADFEN